jgi:hypothetical protein
VRGDPNPFAVDDQNNGPRSRALPPAVAQVASNAAAAGTRVRPTRPIRFTPSRTEPVPPPSTHASPSTEQQPSLVAWLATWTAIGLGWTIFVAWWVIVLQRETARSLGVAFGLLGATLATSVITMWAWTSYNIRIARKGKRGQSSLYVPMQWERDALGRRLELPADEVAGTAPEVRVVLRNGVKAYIAVDAEEL